MNAIFTCTQPVEFLAYYIKSDKKILSLFLEYHAVDSRIHWINSIFTVKIITTRSWKSFRRWHTNRVDVGSILIFYWHFFIILLCSASTYTLWSKNTAIGYSNMSCSHIKLKDSFVVGSYFKLCYNIVPSIRNTSY